MCQNCLAEIKDPESVLNAERENIAKFIALWLPRYPDRFYTFGIYPTFFRKQRELAKQEGDYVKALQLEADAAEMCATQYEKIPIAYGLKGYQKHRDAYRQHAIATSSISHAAKPEERYPKRPIRSETDSAFAQNSKAIPAPQKADVILHIAKSDARVKIAFDGSNWVFTPIHSFQGFAWIVRFSQSQPREYRDRNY